MTERWVTEWSGAAPCQCHSSGDAPLQRRSASPYKASPAGWWPSRRRSCTRAGNAPVVYATKTALRALRPAGAGARRRVRRIDRLLTRLLREGHEDLLSLEGVGIDSAAALLVAAGDNPDRLRSEPS